MHTLLTIASALALTASIWALLRCWTCVDECAASERTCVERIAVLRAERDRLTVAERELDALRRELRKLSGKFYARQREDERRAETEDDYPGDECGHADRDGNGVCRWCGDGELPRQPLPVCENWAVAKQEGPTSEAAKCECLYCSTKRADRARARRELVPKGAQAVAATAKLNAGKP